MTADTVTKEKSENRETEIFQMNDPPIATERDEDMGGQMEVWEKILEFCMFSAENVFRLAWSGDRKNVEMLVQVMFAAELDVHELQRHVRVVDDSCTTGDGEQRRSSKKRIVQRRSIRTESNNDESEAMLYEMDV